MHTNCNLEHGSAAARDLPYRPDVVIEMGAQSLKIHTRCLGRIETVKYSYELGHEVFSSGFISVSTARRIVELCRPYSDRPVFAIGTSAVRDAKNCDALIESVRRQLGIRIRALSRLEEASLLARGYLTNSKRLPALVADVGGGSLELVSLNGSGAWLWDSLPLGVIRLYQHSEIDDRFEPQKFVEQTLCKSAIVTASEIHATGGTVKAIARSLSKPAFDAKDITELERRVLHEGPPVDLKPSRRQVFLPGLRLVRELMEFVRAERVVSVSISIGQVLLKLAAEPDESRGESELRSVSLQPARA